MVPTFEFRVIHFLRFAPKPAAEYIYVAYNATEMSRVNNVDGGKKYELQKIKSKQVTYIILMVCCRNNNLLNAKTSYTLLGFASPRA